MQNISLNTNYIITKTHMNTCYNKATSSYFTTVRQRTRNTCDKISFQGIAENIIRREGPKISFNALKLAIFKETNIPKRIILGNLPTDLAKNDDALKKLVYGNRIVNNLTGIFKGRYISKLPKGGYSKNLKVQTRQNSYVIKIPLNYGLKGGVYKDIFFSNTSEFINGVRVGLGDEAILAFHLTDKGFKNSARFHYYNEEIGCLIKEYVQGKILKSPITDTYLKSTLIKNYGVRILDEKNCDNIVIQKDGSYKLIDFGRWVALPHEP